MSDELTPLLKASIAFAYVGGFTFVALGLYLSLRRGRLHPLLLVCISAISFSWLEAPAAVGVGGRRHRTRDVRRGLRAPPRHEAVG
jgi:hypothetical protein